jgi:hypothetical protein
MKNAAGDTTASHACGVESGRQATPSLARGLHAPQPLLMGSWGGNCSPLLHSQSAYMLVPADEGGENCSPCPDTIESPRSNPA